MVDWLKPYISATCPYCGGEMQELVNDEGKITNRRCSNYLQCPGHNAAKCEDMMKILKIDNIGFQSCLKIIKDCGLTSHLQILEHVSVKPIPLKTALRLLCIDGIDKQWVTECEKNNINTVEDLAKLPPRLKMPLLIKSNADNLAYLLKHITLEVPKQQEDCSNAVNIVVMITGPVNGYKTKEDFIEAMNKKYNPQIRIIHQETKRKTGVDFLIKEPYTNTRGKYEAAVSAGIPIGTSEQFIQTMEELCKQLQSI